MARDKIPTSRVRRTARVGRAAAGQAVKQAGTHVANVARTEEEPIAAASIGQVYRARLHDGRDVAVKVQYPGVAAAVRADMQNLGLILKLMQRVAPGIDVKALAEEVRLRIFEELDYELEAQN